MHIPKAHLLVYLTLIGGVLLLFIAASAQPQPATQSTPNVEVVEYAQLTDGETSTLGLTWSNKTTGFQASDPADFRDKYEASTGIECGDGGGPILDLFNCVGAEGWELIAKEHMPSDNPDYAYHLYTFKRTVR